MLRQHSYAQVLAFCRKRGIRTSAGALAAFWRAQTRPAPRNPEAPAPEESPFIIPDWEQAQNEASARQPARVRLGIPAPPKWPAFRKLPASLVELHTRLEAHRRHVAIFFVEAMRTAGMAHKTACRLLCLNPITVWRWRKAFIARGLAGLTPKVKASKPKARRQRPAAPRFQLRCPVRIVRGRVHLGAPKVAQLRRAA